MTDIPDWVTSVPPDAGVHNLPAQKDQWAGLSDNQAKQLRGQLVESIVSVVTQALTGLFLPGPLGAAFEQLKDWADGIGDAVADIPIFGPFIEWLLSLFGVDIGEPGLPPGLTFDPVGGLTEFANTVVSFFTGLFQPWQVGPITLGRVTNEIPNMVFDTTVGLPPAGTDNPPGTWYHRSDVGHTSPGSAWIEADGQEHELIGQPIAVAKGQQYDPGVWVTWEGPAIGTTDAFQLIVAEFESDGWRTGTHVVATGTPVGFLPAFTQVRASDAPVGQPSSYYTVPEGVGMVALGVRVTAGFTAGTLGVDDLTGPPVGLLQKVWTENLVPNIENIAMLFGITDRDLDGDIDFDDVWNTVWNITPPISGTSVDVHGNTFQDLMDGLAAAFDPVLRLLGGAQGFTAPQLVEKAIIVADAANTALATTVATANSAGDAQANEDDGFETVDLNTFTGAEGQALSKVAGDWTPSQTASVDDVVIRVNSGLPMMGIRNTGTAVPPRNATGSYYSATWNNTFLSTAGYGQMVEMVLGPDGRYGNTFILLHSTATFTDGAYLQVNAAGLFFGTYTKSSGDVYTFSNPLAQYRSPISAGMRVGINNSPDLAGTYNITVNGRTMVQFVDSPTTPVIALDATHLSARILLERVLVVFNAGWPWQTSGLYDSFSPAQVLFSDWDPPSTVGIIGAKHRASATGASVGSSTLWSEWSGVMDTTIRLGGGMLGTGTGVGDGFKVPVAGPYMWHIGGRLSRTQQPGEFWNVGVYVNHGTNVASVGPSSTEITGVSTANTATGGSGIVYCTAGDIVTPASLITGGGNFIGISGLETVTYFTLAKMG